MRITSITIQGEKGAVAIEATPRGARVLCGDLCIAHVNRDEPAQARWEKATEVARALYGEDRKGRVAATGSMVVEIQELIERVAGC